MKAFWRVPKALRNFQDVVRVKEYSSVLCYLTSQENWCSEKSFVLKLECLLSVFYFDAEGTKDT